MSTPLSKDKKGYLVLTLNKKNVLVIDDEIHISFNKMKGSFEVSLAIKAPAHRTLRLKKVEELKEENK